MVDSTAPQKLNSRVSEPDSASLPKSDGESTPDVPFLRDIGLVTTLHCQACCPHCIVRAGPKRTERITPDEAGSWLGQIAEYRDGHILAVALTGGEPFSDLEHLRVISRQAASRGLLVTAVTNAYWATSEAEALRILEDLPEIQILTFSTDVYHQRTIPLSNVENAVLAAQRLGRRYVVALCTRGENDSETDEIERQVERFTLPETINRAHIFPVGRARGIRNLLSYSYSDKPPDAACAMAHSPVIFPDGRVLACFGPIVGVASNHPLMLGNLNQDPLATILDRAEENAVLHAIRLWGPQELIQRMRDAGLESHIPDRYVSKSVCCACFDVLTEPTLVEFLERLGEDADFRREVAFGRVYYLNETRMAETLSTRETPVREPQHNVG